MPYKPVSQLTQEQAEKRRERQREYSQRQNKKYRCFLERWQHFFETGELIPIDTWRATWHE